MIWNCPHCNRSLSLNDHDFEAHWTFTRCYECNGVAVVRLKDATAIKVNDSPFRSENISLEGLMSDPIEPIQIKTPVIRPARRRPRPESAEAPVTPPPFKPKAQAIAEVPAPLPTIPEKTKKTRKWFSFAMTVAAITTMGCSAYLYIEAHRAWSRLRPLLIAQSQTAAPCPAMVSDQLKQSAMAPIRIQTNEPVQVQTRIANARLRSGPGENFRILGVADIQKTYRLAGKKDRWVQIELPGTSKTTAWIRDDLVQSVIAQH